MEDIQERRRALRRLDDHLRSSGIYEPVIACQPSRACFAGPVLLPSCIVWWTFFCLLLVSVAQTLKGRGESCGKHRFGFSLH